jgi:hypothetical protein
MVSDHKVALFIPFGSALDLASLAAQQLQFSYQLYSSAIHLFTASFAGAIADSFVATRLLLLLLLLRV